MSEQQETVRIDIIIKTTDDIDEQKKSKYQQKILCRTNTIICSINFPSYLTIIFVYQYTHGEKKERKKK